MTNLQAITEDLQAYSVRSTTIERQCKKIGLDPNSEILDEFKIRLCVINILSQLISLSGVSQADVSFSFNKDGALIYLKRLCKEAGLDVGDFVGTPTVTFIN